MKYEDFVINDERVPLPIRNLRLIIAASVNDERPYFRVNPHFHIADAAIAGIEYYVSFIGLPVLHDEDKKGAPVHLEKVRQTGYLGSVDIECRHPWGTLVMRAYSGINNTVVIDYILTNRDSRPHSYKLEHFSGAKSYPGSKDVRAWYCEEEQAVVFGKEELYQYIGKTPFPEKYYLAFKSLEPAGEYRLGKGDFGHPPQGCGKEKEVNAPDITGSLIAAAESVEPGITKKTRFVYAFGNEKADVLKRLRSFPPGYSHDDLKKTWTDWLRQKPLPPAALDEKGRKAWYFNFYSLECAKTPQGLIEASPDQFPGQYVWDTCWAAAGESISDPESARTNMDFLLDVMQTGSGYIPYNSVHENRADEGKTQPPLAARTAWFIYTATGDKVWLRRHYFNLVAYYNWLKEKRLDSENLFITGGLESGMDNHPVYNPDQVTISVKSVHMSSIIYDCQMHLSFICEVLGRSEEAGAWNKLARITRTNIHKRMWNEEDGWFYPLQDGKQIRIKTCDSFFALCGGVASDGQAVRMAETIEGLFLTPYGLSSVARNEKVYQPNNYWSGGVWPVMDGVAAEGLYRYGLADLAKKVLEKGIDVQNAYGDSLEVVNPETGRPGTNREVFASARHLSMSAGEQLAAMKYVYAPAVRLGNGIDTGTGFMVESINKEGETLKISILADRPGLVEISDEFLRHTVGKCDADVFLDGSPAGVKREKEGIQARMNESEKAGRMIEIKRR